MADAPSSGGGKIRSKRIASSRKPYSRASSQRRSIFSRVTDSFKSLLNPITPRWLSNKLHHEETSQPSPSVSGHSPSNPDSSVPSTSANHQQHHTNNNYKKSPLCRPPISSRPSSRSSLQYYITPPDTPASEVTSGPSTGGGKEELLKKLAVGSKRIKMSQEPVDSADVSISRKEMDLLKVDDNASVASSSGCSSSMHASQRSTSADREGSIKNLWSSSAESLASGRPSSYHQQATMTSNKRPRFNPAVFGVPVVGPPLRSQDAHLSSFYNGPIQFGGANSSARQPYFATPYKIPSVTKVKVRHVNHQRTPGHSSRSSAESKSPLSESSLRGISSTARKILQTLETMPSPLNDARRIPNMTRTPSTFLAARQRRRTLGSTSLLGSASKGPPTSSLMTPSSVKIRNRANIPLNNSLINRTVKKITAECTDEPVSDTPSTSGSVPDSKSISTRGLPAPIASMSSTASLPKRKHVSLPGVEPSAGGGGKMKSHKRSSAHYSAMHEELEEITPDLPKVALPLTSSLPSFNFGKSGMTSTPAMRPMERKAPSPEFSFASPVVKTSKVEQTAPPATETPKFQFSSPQTKKTSSSSDQGTPKALANFTAGSNPSTPSLVFAPDPKVVSALKTNKRKSSPLAAAETTGGFRPAENLKQGSVMDILNGGGQKAKSPPTTSESPLQKDVIKPLKVSKVGWECGTCLVSNDAEAVQCAACETPKPGSSSAKPSGDGKPWDCEVCLVPNDAGTTKCAACESPKPGSGPAKPQKLSGGLFAGSAIKSSSSSNFSFGVPAKPASQSAAEKKSADLDNKSDWAAGSWGNLIKKKAGNWDCGVCLVSNDASSDKCEACQTPKPGAGVNSQTDNKKIPSQSSQFKFGVPAATSSSATKASGWGLKAASKSDTWECEVCMVPNSNERKTCEACESPKPGTEKKKPVLNTSFKFGENTSGLFKFGIPDEPKRSQPVPEKNVEQEEKKEDKPQQKINFGSVSTENKSEPAKTSVPTFNFGAPAAKAAPSELPTTADKPAPTFSFGVKATEEPKKGETQSKPPALFSFGAPKTSDSAKSPFAAPSLNAFNAQKTDSSALSAAPATQATPFGGSAPSLPASGLSGFNPQFTGTAAQVSKPSTSISSLPNQTRTQDTATGKGIFSGFNTNKTESEQKPDQAKPTFSFGANAAPTKPSAGPAFQFSGSSKAPQQVDSAPKPAFSFGASQPPAQAANPASDKPKSVFGGFGNTQPIAKQQESNPPKPAFGGFNFTGNKTSTQSSSGSIFGSSTPAPNAAPFGAATNTASPFGAPAAKSTPFGSSTSTGSSNIFGAAPKPAFGTPSAQNANSGLPKPSFPAFGGNSNDSPAQKPAGGFAGFGSSQQNSTPTPGGGFAFGAASKPAPAYTAPAPAFQFGGSQAQSNGVFQFGSGANQAKNESAPENKPFVFGGSNPAGTGMTQQPASTGFNFGASTAGSGFNFAGSQPSTPQGPSMFGMAAEAAQNPNPFSAGGNRSTTPVQGPRRIRQARRKLRK